MSDPATMLASAIAARRPGVVEPLLRDATVDGATTFDPTAFEIAFGAAGRRLGTEPLGADATLVDRAGAPWPIAAWGLDEAARALLVLRALDHVARDAQPDWLDTLYRAGALRERQAMLRVLAALPAPERFLPIALDACRASTQPVFDAIACENPYPARHFPDASFNQLALKAVFTGVAVGRIMGVASRRSPELARMASDFADERRAAGRPVPADLALLGAA